MRLVTQEHPMGCGIACVASVAGVTYDRALNATRKELAWTRGYNCRELLNALRRLNVAYTYVKATSGTGVNLHREGTIAFVARSKRYPEGHYLVRTKRGWMNPWINYPHIASAKAGFSQRLPGKAQWLLVPKT